MRRIRDEEQAKDMAQEVYLRLLRLNEPELVRNPQGYVYRIARNVVVEYLMSVEEDVVTYDSEVAEELDVQGALLEVDFGEQLTDQRQLVSVLRQLPRIYREVMLLQKCDGLTYAEIAVELGISIHTVKKYLRLAVARCRTAKWK
jgi:RNA polymerase sigma-70 factor (ECF subfamily)